MKSSYGNVLPMCSRTSIRCLPRSSASSGPLNGAGPAFTRQPRLPGMVASAPPAGKLAGAPAAALTGPGLAGRRRSPAPPILPARRWGLRRFLNSDGTISGSTPAAATTPGRRLLRLDRRLRSGHATPAGPAHEVSGLCARLLQRRAHPRAGGRLAADRQPVLAVRRAGQPAAVVGLRGRARRGRRTLRPRRELRGAPGRTARAPGHRPALRGGARVHARSARGAAPPGHPPRRPPPRGVERAGSPGPVWGCAPDPVHRRDPLPASARRDGLHAAGGTGRGAGGPGAARADRDGSEPEREAVAAGLLAPARALVRATGAGRRAARQQARGAGAVLSLGAYRASAPGGDTPARPARPLPPPGGGRGAAPGARLRHA